MSVFLACLVIIIIYLFIKLIDNSQAFRDIKKEFQAISRNRMKRVSAFPVGGGHESIQREQTDTELIPPRYGEHSAKLYREWLTDSNGQQEQDMVLLGSSSGVAEVYRRRGVGKKEPSLQSMIEAPPSRSRDGDDAIEEPEIKEIKYVPRKYKTCYEWVAGYVKEEIVITKEELEDMETEQETEEERKEREAREEEERKREEEERKREEIRSPVFYDITAIWKSYMGILGYE